jgi:hypothetical protein
LRLGRPDLEDKTPLLGALASALPSAFRPTAQVLAQTRFPRNPKRAIVALLDVQETCLFLNPIHLVVDFVHVSVLLPDAFIQRKLHRTAIGSHPDRTLLKAAFAEKHLELSFV